MYLYIRIIIRGRRRIQAIALRYVVRFSCSAVDRNQESYFCIRGKIIIYILNEHGVRGTARQEIISDYSDMYVYVYMYVHVYIYVYVCVYITCMHIYIYIYIYIHI